MVSGFRGRSFKGDCWVMFGDLLVLNKQSNGSALTLEPLSQGPLCRQRLAAAKRALWDKGGGILLF